MTKRKHILAVIQKILAPASLIGVLVSGLAFVGLNTPLAHATGTATLSLSPSSGTFDSGSNFTVTIHENSGSTSINETTAILSYNPAQLEYISNDISVSAFDLPAPHSGGGGVVTIGLGSDGMLTGDQVVANVTFKVLATSGTMAINFSGDPTNLNGSTITAPSQPNYWDGNTTGGTYTVTGTSSGGSGSGGTGATSSGSSSSPSSTATTQPKSTGSATTPATKSVTNNPAVASGSTVGYSVAIKVVDSKGQPVLGAQVVLDGTETTVTDVTGIAGFTNVPAGSHKVSVTNGANKTPTTLSFAVANQAPTALQQFQVKLSSGKKLTSYLWISILIIILLIIFGGGISILRKLTTKFKVQSLKNNLDKTKPSAIADAKTTPTATTAVAPTPTVTPTTSTDSPQVFYPKTPRKTNPNNNPEVNKT